MGPHSRRIVMQTRRRSRVSQSGCTHAAKRWTNRLQYRILAWRSPPMAIADVHHHLSHRSDQMYEETTLIASPSPQFACPQRGRKRLSREATLHTELALEWPDLVQIGRCKVQWPPTDLNKQILTSFWKYKTITQHGLSVSLRWLLICNTE